MDNNLTYILIISVLIILSIGFHFVQKNLKYREKRIGKSPVMSKKSEKHNDSLIRVEKFPFTSDVKEIQLHEIKDSSLISRVSSLSPAIVKALGKTQTTTTSTTTTMAGDFYKVIIPKGAELAKSQSIKGMTKDLRRGLYHDSKGIKGHAEFQKVNPKVTTDVTQTTKMATSSVANVMNVASLIVGQYYMSEVNTKLDGLSKFLRNLNDFQQLEFKSNVRALIVNIRDLSNFTEEIFEDDTIRNNTLMQLNQFKSHATQLIEQVNLSLEEACQKTSIISYQEYKDKLDELDSLCYFQQILLQILKEISQLDFVFGKGEISEEKSTSIFQYYRQESINVNMLLASWHNEQIKQFEINLDEKRRRKQGVKGLVSNVQGIIKDEWRYLKLDDMTVNKIKHQQLIEKNKESKKDYNLYGEDTQLLIKEGNLYLWLPE